MSATPSFILRDLLYQVPLVATAGSTDVVITSVTTDSRKVGSGTLFIAIPGVTVDGHQFIGKAVELGAQAIVCETLPEDRVEGVTYVQVRSSSQAWALMASTWFGHPAKKLTIVGVTGTNGKTTVATLLYQLFMRLGYQTGLLSTVKNYILDQAQPATHTTPDAWNLHAMLAQMVEAGCTHVFMEVSSHALVQNRVYGLPFAGAIFTNITHDHLDYHGTFDNYIKAKKLLFDGLSSKAFALVNLDDKRGTVMLQNSKATHLGFAMKNSADYTVRLLANSLHGLQLEIEGYQVWFRLTGEFNAYNLLAVYATAVRLGEHPEEVLRALSEVDSVRGRFERFVSAQGVTVIIDYAHTPDALENVLSTITQMRTHNETLITVVGCGGDRDRSKRPIMAGVACQYANKVIFTSDNPRSEDPAEIVREMQAGVPPSQYKKTQVELDRRAAIALAHSMAHEGDIVLIAGKGHETYQEIAGVKYDFDDRAVAQEIFGIKKGPVAI